jgi:hypothetical protein
MRRGGNSPLLAGRSFGALAYKKPCALAGLGEGVRTKSKDGRSYPRQPSEHMSSLPPSFCTIPAPQSRQVPAGLFIPP